MRASQDTPASGGRPAVPTEGPLPDTELQRKAGLVLITEPLSFEDGQAVQLEDGSMAYIHRTPRGGVPVMITGGEEGRQSWQRLGLESCVHLRVRAEHGSSDPHAHPDPQSCLPSLV